MNQILATQKEEEKKQNRGKKTDIKKVIKVSSVLIITFGIVIAGQGIWNVINSNAQPEFPKNILSNVDNTQNQNIDNNQNNNQNIGNDLPEQNGNIEQYGTQIELAVVGNKLKITA